MRHFSYSCCYGSEGLKAVGRMMLFFYSESLTCESNLQLLKPPPAGPECEACHSTALKAVLFHNKTVSVDQTKVMMNTLKVSDVDTT